MSKFVQVFSLAFVFILLPAGSIFAQANYREPCDPDLENPCVQNPSGGTINCHMVPGFEELHLCLHDLGRQEIGEECVISQECQSGVCNVETCVEPLDGGTFSPVQLPSCASGGGWPSAIGCIEYSSPQKTAGAFLKFSIPFVGGIVLVLIAYASFIYITSAGNPKQTQLAREILTAALVGGVTVVLSVWLLRVIGFDVLGLFG